MGRRSPAWSSPGARADLPWAGKLRRHLDVDPGMNARPLTPPAASECPKCHNEAPIEICPSCRRERPPEEMRGVRAAHAAQGAVNALIKDAEAGARAEGPDSPALRDAWHRCFYDRCVQLLREEVARYPAPPTFQEVPR
jgi:hypothetical protein